MTYFGVFAVDEAGFRHMYYVKAENETQAQVKLETIFAKEPEIMRLPENVSEWPAWENRDVIHWVTLTPEAPG